MLRGVQESLAATRKMQDRLRYLHQLARPVRLGSQAHDLPALPCPALPTGSLSGS